MAFPKPMAFPPAWIWGFALFLALKEPIQSDIIIVAALGGEANFHCNFLPSMDVLQATWQKRNGASFHNMATYSPIHGLRPQLSSSKISHLRMTHYRCIFNVFRHGSLSKDIRLNIQTISELRVEFCSLFPVEGLLTAVCSATGKPAPSITWLDDRALEERPQIHHIQNINGTVTVASRLTFSASHLHSSQNCCGVNHSPTGCSTLRIGRSSLATRALFLYLWKQRLSLSIQVPTGSQLPLASNRSSVSTPPTVCEWISASIVDPTGCRGTICFTIVLATSCRRISAMTIGAPPPHLFSTDLSAAMFCSLTCPHFLLFSDWKKHCCQ
uniref:CD80-like immunoglobulin C2-set domain-containing protein n=1 Tax=Junco hyemalis TaxID=40217 RepID=A0A8C5NTR3_JUNHY